MGEERELVEEEVERMRLGEEAVESREHPPGHGWSMGSTLSALGEISVGGICGAPLQCVGPGLPGWLRQQRGRNLCISYRRWQRHRKF